MTLTREQVAFFAENGYLAVEAFFTERENAAILAELTRLHTEGKARNVAVQADGSKNNAEGAMVNFQVIPLNDKSPIFRALPFHPKVADGVSQLIGDSMRLHLDQSFWKPAKKGIGTSWHQDNAYFKISDPMKGTAMWIAVHEATTENGCLNVIPGSFRESYPHERDPLSDHHIRCSPPEEKSVALEMKPGGVVFFCYGTAHCTRNNLSDRDRAGVALHFIHTDEAQSEFWFKHEHLRPMLRGPLATGGLREYGEQVEGTWETIVDSVLGT